ncbi:SDR family oxidoreductase [Carboxylicivirga sp. M1479]|uniref:SDR family oxidoreductase n=1 Tax=Carboxylicivirga sp. M1479 TaxID=2594476 RepID=UPI0011787668|nr:SDR family oxidoreductase [Carboxylicivirga sp. M1479]TRX66109.1 SDR family oxidoreductase [Carboxylicivirga sp. M1479]
MQDKVIIITGASSGIGLACAREFAQRGAKLAIAARSVDKLAEIEQELKSNGHEVIAVGTDVSIEADCKHLVSETLKAYGRIDILVNNAGISMRARFEDADLNVLKQLMDVNFWGTVYCTKYALPSILENKGSVVGISSIAGYVGLPGRSGYSASKFAMQGFLETIRIENLKKDLHVLIAAPGFTASNVRKVALTADGSNQGVTPRKEEKMMSAEEVAVHLAHAILKRKRTLILTFLEGKFTVFLKKIAPRLLEKLAFDHMAKEPNSPVHK